MSYQTPTSPCCAPLGIQGLFSNADPNLPWDVDLMSKTAECPITGLIGAPAIPVIDRDWIDVDYERKSKEYVIYEPEDSDDVYVLIHKPENVGKNPDRDRNRRKRNPTNPDDEADDSIPNWLQSEQNMRDICAAAIIECNIASLDSIKRCSEYGCEGAADADEKLGTAPNPDRKSNRCIKRKAALFPFPAAVARPVSRREVAENPSAIAAVNKEWGQLEVKGVWNRSTVREWSDVCREAREQKRNAHLGTVSGRYHGRKELRES